VATLVVSCVRKVSSAACALCELATGGLPMPVIVFFRSVVAVFAALTLS
jgi:hypothetical protein